MAAYSLVVFANVHQCQLLTGVKALFQFAEGTFLDATFCIVGDGQESRHMFYGNLSRENYKAKESEGVAEDTRAKDPETFRSVANRESYEDYILKRVRAALAGWGFVFPVRNSIEGGSVQSRDGRSNDFFVRNFACGLDHDKNRHRSFLALRPGFWRVLRSSLLKYGRLVGLFALSPFCVVRQSRKCIRRSLLRAIQRVDVKFDCGHFAIQTKHGAGK
jgi:hypothetical protein